jgi:hypothetical protein
LYAGEASSSAKTSENSKRYMKDFMNYSEEQQLLLMDLFRHKLVHLAQPKPVINRPSSSNSDNSPAYQMERIAWRYFHDSTEKHLVKEKALPGSKCTVISGWELEFDSVFNIGISQLVDNIRVSVGKPNGYLENLEKNEGLLKSFEKAIKEIFDS